MTDSVTPPGLSPESPDFSPQGNATALKRQSAVGAAVTMGSQGTKFVLQFGSQVVLARLLLPTDFGLLAMVGPLVAAALLLTDLGLSAATVQRPTINQVELSSLFWLNVLIGCGLAGVAIAAAPLAAIFYATPAVTPVMMTMAAALLLSSLSAQHIALLNRRMRFGAIAMIEVGALIAGVIVGVGGALWGLGCWSLVAMQVTNGAATLILACVFSRWRPSRPGISRDALHLLRFGGTVTGYNLLGYLITNLDNILIGARFGARPLGIYDRAYKLMFQPLWQMTAPAARGRGAVAVAAVGRSRRVSRRVSRDARRRADADHAGHPVRDRLCQAGDPGAARRTLDRVRADLRVARRRRAQPAAAPGRILAVRQPGACAGTAEMGRAGIRRGDRGLSHRHLLGPQGVAMSAAISSAAVQIPMMWWAVTRSGPVTRSDAIRLLVPIAAAAAIAGGLLALAAYAFVWASLPMLALAGVLAYALFIGALALFPEGRIQLAKAGGSSAGWPNAGPRGRPRSAPRRRGRGGRGDRRRCRRR
ncbi:oligosaccharide flippase family protein [Sphingomonas aurantiaca]